jgi:hypothetical protein
LRIWLTVARERPARRATSALVTAIYSSYDTELTRDN